MWRSLISAVLLCSLMLPTTIAYSRFGQSAYGLSNGPLSINDQILSGSNIQYYGRFRSGQDDVLNRYFQRLT
ncbi:unnamed protein product [Nippostrongylus brasiliensis]|uniref:Secreted protein n=1 Tax=Nippostrongylus brasiliensis TaxID=27835 RepID=A0A0N4Y2V0_NIPBR|nr:hypothetical protein Q1695_001832 [Nippostrongylus brasiliensis]VDL73659.1 unnamed protein product [Nippostrongylus brasiliensis]